MTYEEVSQVRELMAELLTARNTGLPENTQAANVALNNLQDKLLNDKLKKHLEIKKFLLALLLLKIIKLLGKVIIK